MSTPHTAYSRHRPVLHRIAGRVVALDRDRDLVFVRVDAANQEARQLVGRKLAVDLRDARLTVEISDRDGDGRRTLRDVAISDRVTVHALMPPGASLARGRFAARDATISPSAA